MSSRELHTGLASLNFARRMTLAFLDGTPDELWNRVPVPGGNNAIWIAGHVAWEDDSVLEGLVDDHESTLPPSWAERFAQGTRPSDNMADYPPIPEIRAQLDAQRAAFIDYFKANVDRLAELLPEQWHGFAKDRSALMNAVACHEMVHVGQLTVVRKSLNLQPVFG